MHGAEIAILKQKFDMICMGTECIRNEEQKYMSVWISEFVRKLS